MHDHLVGHVWARQQVKVGAWIQQFACNGVCHAILDQEAIVISLLVIVNCARNLFILNCCAFTCSC